MNNTDLKYGNVVELRNGDRFLYIGDKHNSTADFLNLVKKDFDLYIHSDRYDLIYDHNDNFVDIMKVYKDYTLKELLWQRKEKPKLTDDEKAILRNIPKDYKWIVRDEDSNLHIFINKPYKIDCLWYAVGDVYNLYIFKHLFQSIKWEDEEPYNIEDLLKGELLDE